MSSDIGLGVTIFGGKYLSFIIGTVDIIINWI